jgi:uncharacterized protein (DUF885 family)
MNTRLSTAGLCACALVIAFSAAPARSADAAGDAAFTTLANDYLDNFYFPENPTTATADGIHKYDDRLEDYSKAATERSRRTLHAYATRFEAIDPAGLSVRARGDRELLLSSIRSNLLTIETIRPQDKNPDVYSSGIANSAFVIMERAFAPANERLRLITAREKAMPAVLSAARLNLVNPPKIYTQIAIEQLPGTISFFENDLPLAFVSADDPVAKREFKLANARVISALKSYEEWLRKDLLPRSTGSFALGAATFRAKLSADEMVDTPLDELERIGLADLRRNQAEFARVAHELEPGKTPQEVLAMLDADHPTPAALLDSVRGTLDGLANFIKAKQIVTIPSEVRPLVRETPPFMRATTFASMDTPGPYETVASEAYFNVTLPDPAWDAKRINGFMAQFNYPLVSNVAVHEAYPGHYVQFLWMHQVDDRVRKLFGASSNAEGWAHYCEQMMLEQGFGQPGVGSKDARGALLLKLGQLEDALLRDARYLVGIRLHTQGLTLEQGADFFVKEGYQSREVGETETKRGTADPTYLYYTLGKLQILKLRADLQAREGKDFTLKSFHDRFMQQGFPPIRIVRRALLGDDSPTL